MLHDISTVMRRVGLVDRRQERRWRITTIHENRAVQRREDVSVLLVSLYRIGVTARMWL